MWSRAGTFRPIVIQPERFVRRIAYAEDSIRSGLSSSFGRRNHNVRRSSVDHRIGRRRSMNNRQLTGIFGGLLGLLSMIMPWISLTVGIFMSGSPPRTIEASPFDFVRTFATSSSGNTTTGNADLDQALEMISANVFVALVGAFILIVGSVAALLYPKIGGLAMITGWMISLFGLYIMNNQCPRGWCGFGSWLKLRLYCRPRGGARCILRGVCGEPLADRINSADRTPASTDLRD